MRVFLLVMALVCSSAQAGVVKVIELEGNPFAKLEIVNSCGGGDRELYIRTSRGPVILYHEETDKSCGEIPDYFEVRELPLGIAADPLRIELIENGFKPSDPGYIYLYHYEGM